MNDFLDWGGDGILKSINIESAPILHDIILNQGNIPVTKFFSQLSSCQAMFISGGDQNKICDVINSHPQIKEMILRYYNNGILPIAGTSAGAAIMSSTMITGEGDFDCIDHDKVETKLGLGFVSHFVIDRKFIRRILVVNLLMISFCNYYRTFFETAAV